MSVAKLLFVAPAEFVTDDGISSRLICRDVVQRERGVVAPGRFVPLIAIENLARGFPVAATEKMAKPPSPAA